MPCFDASHNTEIDTVKMSLSKVTWLRRCGTRIQSESQGASNILLMFLRFYVVISLCVCVFTCVCMCKSTCGGHVLTSVASSFVLHLIFVTGLILVSFNCGLDTLRVSGERKSWLRNCPDQIGLWVGLIVNLYNSRAQSTVGSTIPRAGGPGLCKKAS